MADEQEVPRALTLTNLLIVMSFFLAFQTVFMEVHSKHKTWTGTAVAVLSGLVWAVLTGYSEWKLLFRLVSKIKNDTLLNIFGLSLLICWPIFVGLTGAELAAFFNTLLAH
jgi:hypothetical protein